MGGSLTSVIDVMAAPGCMRDSSSLIMQVARVGLLTEQKDFSGCAEVVHHAAGTLQRIVSVCGTSTTSDWEQADVITLLLACRDGYKKQVNKGGEEFTSAELTELEDEVLYFENIAREYSVLE